MTAYKDRYPSIAPADFTPEQRATAEAIIAGPRGAVYGPFVPLLRSPELMDCAQRMGEYLRYRSAIGTVLSELAILVTARYWTQQFEWAIHAPIALKVGISREIVDAISRGERPAKMSEQEAAVYDFCIEIHRDKMISDATHDKLKSLFGEKGVIDLLGINGYYTFLSMVMNGAQTAYPETEVPALKKS